MDKLKGMGWLVFLFIGIIVFFVIVTFSLLIKNNWTTDTLEILLPAIGAILLSIFIGIKQIYIDKAEPDEYVVPIAILVNQATGDFISMAGKNVDLSDESYYLLNSGIGFMDRMPEDKVFDTIDFDKELRKDKYNELFAEEMTQYAFWRWFRAYQGYDKARWKGHDHYVGINRLNKSFIRPGSKQHPDLTRIVIQDQYNRFIQMKGLDFQLLKDFKIFRNDDENYILDTGVSTFTMKYTGLTGEKLENTEFANKILKLNGCEYDENYILWVFRAVFRFEQKPFYKYSKQYKYEKLWHSIIKKEIYEAFSWKAVRQLYVDNLIVQNSQEKVE